ncbi:putative ribonuclease H-like domain-containing protein [Tanacetum coccineum]
MVKSAFLYGKIEEESWYETVPSYLLSNGFQGKIDKTLFIKRYQGDILLVQVYVDDIIFGSTKKELCIKFEKLMHEKFQMSSMGELTFFLGLQVQQKKDGIFISQDKYVGEILKKFGFIEVKATSTPMETQKPLLKNEDGEEVDVRMYRSMISSLMYLTSSRPNIMFTVCACARYQVNPKVLHLHAMKNIFRYLKGQPKLGLWYPKDSPFDLVAYPDSDYARASLDRKSTTRGCQFLGCRLISWQWKKQTVVANSIIEAKYVADSSCCGQSVWTGIGVNAGNSELMLLGINLILLVKVNAVRHNLLLLLKVIAARHNLQLLVNINAVEECEGFEQIVDFLNAHAVKHALTVNPTIYTYCIEQFWATVKVKTVNGEVQLQALVDGKKIIITESNVGRDLQLEDAEGVDCLPNASIFEQLTLISSNITAWNEFSSTMTSAIICLATNQKFNFSKYIFESMVKNLDNIGKFLMYPRSRRPKRKDTEVPQPSGPITNVADEAVNDEMDDSLVRAATTATSLDAEHDRKERKNKGLPEEKPTVKKPTYAWDYSSTKEYHVYILKNMEMIVKSKSLKNKSFANIQELFDKAMKKVNTFVDYRIEMVEESSKKAGTKLEEDKEFEELKQCLEIILDDGDDVTIDATPLSTKSPTIVDYKIYKEGKKNNVRFSNYQSTLEVLWSIVKARFKKTEPVNYMDNFLLLNLKTMFEHHVEDNVWKNQQGLVKVLN